MNKTAKDTLAQVRSDHPRPVLRRVRRLADWRLVAALAVLSISLSSLIGLYTVTQQRDDQNKITDALTREIALLESRAEGAEGAAARAAEQADLAADLGADNRKLLEDQSSLLREVNEIALAVDAVLTEQGVVAAGREKLVAAAIARILDGIAAGNEGLEEAITELRALVGTNAEALARLDRLIAEAENEARDDGRQTVAEEEAGVPAQTTTTTTPPPPPTTTTTEPDGGLLDPLL